MSEASPPQPFLIDIGNVLCTFDFDAMIRRLDAQSSGSPDTVVSEFDELKDHYESGAWDDEKFIEHVTTSVGFEGTRDDFVATWTEIFTQNEPMAETVEALHTAGHPLYLLSNTNELHLRYLLATFPVFSHFADGVYSHRAGSIKPQRRIYEIAFERFGLAPGETLYIDDLPQNIATGKELGLISHQYDPDSHSSLLQWLTENGVTAADGTRG